MKENSFIALIPARGGSKRLPKKNIYPFLGKPMILWAIDACWKSMYLNRDSVFVSTDNDEIAKVCRNYGVKVVKRPKSLASDTAPLIAILRDFARKYIVTTEKGYNALICLQPNVPGRASDTLDRCVELYLAFDRKEVRVYNENGVETGSVWIINLKHLFDKGLSTYTGAVIDPAIEIHSLENVKKAEEQVRRATGDTVGKEHVMSNV